MSDIQERIQVAIRIRPLNTNEIENLESAISVRIQGNNLCLVNRKTSLLFPLNFDFVFPQLSSQEQLYHQLGLPMIERSLMGINTW